MKYAKNIVFNKIMKLQYRTSTGFLGVILPYPIPDDVCKHQYKAYSYHMYQ